MSDVPRGAGWWQASDLKWYPPDQVPGPETESEAPPASPWGAAPPAPDWGAPPASDWGASPYGGGTHGPSAQAGSPHGGPPVPGAAFGGIPGYQAYGAYPAGYGTGLPSVEGLATASLVLGILSLVSFFCYGIGVLFAIVGLVLGLIALSRINKGQADPGPRGQALAGAICSGICLAITLVGVIIVLLFVFSN